MSRPNQHVCQVKGVCRPQRMNKQNGMVCVASSVLTCTLVRIKNINGAVVSDRRLFSESPFDLFIYPHPVSFQGIS